MAIVEMVKGLIETVDTGPNTYHCPDCGRSFEVDAPPDRVICSDCGNEDVEIVAE